MIEHITISKQKNISKSRDFEYLREKGIEYVERIGSKMWTDYNIHDPGITILELLCYAITDLGYRTNFPVADLLATSGDNEKNFADQFFTALQILPTRPVSETDLRKLFIDIPEVKNAWLFKAGKTLFIDKEEETITPVQPSTKNSCSFDLNGLYNIRIEFEETLLKPADTAEGQQQREDILEEVRKKFHKNRNLCEDLESVSAVEEEKIVVCADIEIKPDANAEDIYAQILFLLQNYFSPPVHQYTLEQMTEMKKEDGTSYTFDEIFNGPALENGFIPDEEVQRSTLRTVVYTSDIINLVMDIKGVVSIKNVLLNYCNKDNKNQAREWCLSIPDGKKPAVCLSKASLHFYKDVIPLKVSKDNVIIKYNAMIDDSLEEAKNVKTTDRDFDKGEFADAATYTSIVHHLPKVYGVSEYGLPASATSARQAQAKQLKGYFLFFEQLFANYLAQLSNVRELFRLTPSADIYSYLPQTYFSQKLTGESDLVKLITDYANFDTSGNLQEITEDFETAISRKNRFLDHLLSRFAEQFSEYALQLFTVYGPKSENELIIDKSVFLQEYDVISRNRSGAYNYYDNALDVWDTTNISGMEHRIARLLGWGNYSRRTLSGMSFTSEITKTTNNGNDEFRFRITDSSNKILLTSTSKYDTEKDCTEDLELTIELAAHTNNYSIKPSGDKFFFTVDTPEGVIMARRFEFFDSMKEVYQAINILIGLIKQQYTREGMFLVEHILLRNEKTFLPVCVGDDCDGCDDPYSFRISVVLPAETAAFKNMGFREYVEKMIRLETPAHIYPRICWVKDDILKEFEDKYQAWLKFKQENTITTDEGEDAVKDLIEILYKLKSVYPPGKLMNCEDEKKPVKPVITGQTNLGDL